MLLFGAPGLQELGILENVVLRTPIGTMDMLCPFRAGCSVCMIFWKCDINISIHQSLSIWKINIIKNTSQVGSEIWYKFCTCKINYVKKK